MIRFLFRLIGLFVLAGAFVALVYDGTKTIAGNDIYITKLGLGWTNLHFASLQALQTAVTRYLGPWAWDAAVKPVLEQPAWLVLAILGALFILLGRKKKALIGYARD
jgi:hypothetical protein